MALRVAARDGRQWTVRRHWAPRFGNETLWARFRRRFSVVRRRSEDIADADPGRIADGLDDLIVGLAVVAAIAFLVFIGIPFVVAVVELVGLLLLTLLGVLARVFLRRPWTVEARADGGPCIEWRVVGWRRSSETIREVARRLEGGEALPSAAAGPPVL